MRSRALAVLAVAVVATGVTYGTAAAHEDGSRFVKAEDARFVTGVTPFIGSVHTLFNFNASKEHGDVDGFASFEQQPYNVGTLGLTHLQGKLTCLDIRGNRAGFAFQADVGSTPTFIGQYVTGTVEDNGPGKADKIAVVTPVALPPNTLPVVPSGCAPAATTNNLTQGNVKIGRGDGDDKDGIDRTDY